MKNEFVTNGNVPNPNDKRLVGDDVLQRIANKMHGSEIISEQSQQELDDEAIYIVEEIREIKKMIRGLRREVKSIIREELDNLMDGATLITEGAGDEMHIVLGSHHFKGKVKLVQKKK